MKTNDELQNDVIDEIKWDPQLKDAHTQIGVAVHDGVVTLTGEVDSYSKKIAAEKAAQRVHGTKVVAGDVEVKFSKQQPRSDSQIAEVVKNALRWNSALDEEKIKVRVEDGWVYLEGTVDWEFQKTFASFLWTLFGTRDAFLVLPFNAKGKAFLSRSGELASAIGPHIFKLEDGKYFELERIISLLSIDPSTRRAVVQFLKQEDLGPDVKDVPCYNHMQFFIRHNKLHSHVVMRSQSALMLLPYDFFLFSMLHEAISVRLGIELGSMWYTASSFHIYEDELPFAYEVVQRTISPVAYDKMVDFSNKTIEDLKKFFQDLSYVYLSNPQTVLSNLEGYGLDAYWKSLIKRHF